MQVKFVDLSRQYATICMQINQKIQEVLASSAFSGGRFTETFEREFAQLYSVKHCIAVNSGTAALQLALMACDITAGDEVIVPANTFFATAEAISLCGARPVFVDCDQHYGIDAAAAEQAFSDRTKAVIPVHMYGQSCDMTTVLRFAREQGCTVIEDCAQSHLARWQRKLTGTFGLAACFSFYPSKNLGAYGEGGAVLTNDDTICTQIQSLRNHGSAERGVHQRIGLNGRMDGLQAAVLTVKLQYLTEWTRRRQELAAVYLQHLHGIQGLVLPALRPGAEHVYHLFVVRTGFRNQLQQHLHSLGIETGIHYPVPCHRQPAYASPDSCRVVPDSGLRRTDGWSEQLLSLPMHDQMTEQEALYVCSAIRGFFRA